MILETNTFPNFIEMTSLKRLVAFGATVFMQVIAENYKELNLDSKVDYVVDNDPKKDGTGYELCGVVKTVHALDYLLKDNLNEIALLIGSDGYALEMVRQLQEIEALKQVPCFLLPIMIMDRVDDTCDGVAWPKEARIPRIIHCFWFSDDEKDELTKRCIDSWRRFCPDFEIKEWNSHNYDYTKNPYMYEAYKARKWAYVTDYARLDAVYEYGGFYFDMDLELTRGIDQLLGYEFVTGFGPIRDVELAAFGAAKGSDMVAKMLALYDGKMFVAGSSLTLKDVQPILMDKFMEGLGFEIDGRYQNRDGVAILPRDVFSPRNWFTGEVEVLDSSFGVHHCAGGWVDKQAQVKRKEALKELKELARKLP
ncbi:glycosyltransferase family 32 protein [Butyrivibrio proteoclasticus]|uniref:glycosyltransferase family 32 protein n=1 Tax=Butyrivibrio proteoclasticus TaxID=43305 RepID=UPI00047D1775|nr:glycosyltransferase [Butyrivibrio proteoclasticus]